VLHFFVVFMYFQQTSSVWLPKMAMEGDESDIAYNKSLQLLESTVEKDQKKIKNLESDFPPLITHEKKIMELPHILSQSYFASVLYNMVQRTFVIKFVLMTASKLFGTSSTLSIQSSILLAAFSYTTAYYTDMYSLLTSEAQMTGKEGSIEWLAKKTGRDPMETYSFLMGNNMGRWAVAYEILHMWTVLDMENFDFFLNKLKQSKGVDSISWELTMKRTKKLMGYKWGATRHREELENLIDAEIKNSGLFHSNMQKITKSFKLENMDFHNIWKEVETCVFPEKELGVFPVPPNPPLYRVRRISSIFRSRGKKNAANAIEHVQDPVPKPPDSPPPPKSSIRSAASRMVTGWMSPKVSEDLKKLEPVTVVDDNVSSSPDPSPTEEKHQRSFRSMVSGWMKKRDPPASDSEESDPEKTPEVMPPPPPIHTVLNKETEALPNISKKELPNVITSKPVEKQAESLEKPVSTVVSGWTTPKRVDPLTKPDTESGKPLPPVPPPPDDKSLKPSSDDEESKSFTSSSPSSPGPKLEIVTPRPESTVRKMRKLENSPSPVARRGRIIRSPSPSPRKAKAIRKSPQKALAILKKKNAKIQQVVQQENTRSMSTKVSSQEDTSLSPAKSTPPQESGSSSSEGNTPTQTKKVPQRPTTTLSPKKKKLQRQGLSPSPKKKKLHQQALSPSQEKKTPQQVTTPSPTDKTSTQESAPSSPTETPPQQQSTPPSPTKKKSKKRATSPSPMNKKTPVNTLALSKKADKLIARTLKDKQSPSPQRSRSRSPHKKKLTVKSGKSPAVKDKKSGAPKTQPASPPADSDTPPSTPSSNTGSPVTDP
jgi:hypothetical protein